MKKPIPFGKYYLLDRISVGGMAEVFKGKAFGVEGFERLVAVKRILPSIAEDEEFITMFIDEAKIAVQLQHANIAQIFDLGKVGDSYFIAMEYVSGKDLRSIFDRMRKNGQSIPIPMACYGIMRVCEGLDYAHNRKDAAGRDLNLVHRDVSPQNVLVSYDGEAKIIDFGIAKAAGKAGKTQAGILKGKFGYMSPEQVRGLPLDRRSDIFAVGIVLWELITGERLFVGESDFSTLEKVRNVEITPPSTYNRRIPDDLEKIVLKALSKDVEDRYQSAMDLHDDLQSWMYTSGNFFARKDLARFMQEIFREEIEKESSANEGAAGDIVRSTVPPPPKVARPVSSRATQKPGAPPPPPQTAPPPPPPSRGGAASLPSRPGPAAAPPRPAGPARAAPPSAAKRTMMGMPSAQVPERPNSPPAPVPSDLAHGAVATPVAPGAGIGMDDWDDDEPPTNIYSKETAAEMAHAALASQQQRPGPSTPPKPPTPPPHRQPDPVQFSDDSDIELSTRKRPLSPAIMGIAAAVVIIIVAAIVFMVTRPSIGSVKLSVEPGDELQVIIAGTKTLPGTQSPFTIDELEPGEVNFQIKRPGYSDHRFTVNVRSGETSARQIQLKKIITGLNIMTNPPGASVWIDDRPIEDKTPLIVTDLKPGTHSIRLAKGENYAPKNVTVDLQEGDTPTIKKDLELKSVQVTFVSEPAKARATLYVGKDTEGKDLGFTPVKEEIDTTKDYKVKFELKGHDTQEKKIEWKAGETNIEIAAVMVKEKGEEPTTDRRPHVSRPERKSGTGTLSLMTTPWSQVYIDGKFIKATPLIKHALRAGSHTVTMKNPNFNLEKKIRVTIRANQETKLVRNLVQ